MNELVIRSHRGPYRVRFGTAFEGLEEGLSEKHHLIIDERVARLYETPLTRPLRGHSVLLIKAAESNKALDAFPAYATHLIERGIRRDHLLIAVGGGIIQDIAAFLSATLLRGVAWKFYPTTLLAQADSCIGSKSSVNVGPYKNQLGTFTPPSEILISTGVLDTLSDADQRSGIGEMIKAHIISGPEDADRILGDYPCLLKDKALLLRTIRRSLEIKKTKIEADEFDRDERLVMNYGHTFGHAIESATDYAVPHGIAVTIGMDIANFVSWKMGLIERALYDRFHSLLAANSAGFETVPIPEGRFFTALSRDKKNTSTETTAILMRGPGRLFRGRYPRGGDIEGFCRKYLSGLNASKERPSCLER